MKTRGMWLAVSVLAVVLLAGGCARAARSTEGFALVDSTTVKASFEDAWQNAKAVLREKELDVYTRDKRGVFVAFSPMERQLKLFTPHRTKYTVTVEEASPDTVKISVETVDQVYGVTLLTYPDWHDRKTKDNTLALSILEEVKARLS